MVQKFYELKNISLIQRVWRAQFVKSKAPCDIAIKNIVTNLKKIGSVAHIPPKQKNPDQNAKSSKMS